MRSGVRPGDPGGAPERGVMLSATRNGVSVDSAETRSTNHDAGEADCIHRAGTAGWSS